MAELPQNWIESKLEYIVWHKKGSKPKKLYISMQEGYVPYIDIKAFEKNILEQYTEINLAKLTKPNNILVVWDGARAGLVGLAPCIGAIGSTLVDIEPKTKEIINKYLYYFLFSNYAYINSKPRGTGTPHVNPDLYWNMLIPLPPSNEQKRIVEKLDKIMRIVDDVNERLDKIPTALKRARQSILNQAITGELTKDWRKKNNIQITKDDLKNKIQTELNFLYRNKKITKENLQIKIDDIRENSCSSWFNIKARFLCHHITKGTTPKQILEIGAIPYLKVYNIVNNKIDFSYKPQFVSFETHNTFLERSKVYPNDVVMNIVGPPLGKVAIIPNDYKEWNINQALAIFRPIKYLLSEYVYIVLSCDSTLLPVLPDVKGIVGQSNISLEQCRNLLFPLPPIEEQTEIIRRVKLAFEKLDKIESRYQKAKEYSDKLTQPILNKAFRGELVPQDPNDKPLEII